MYMKSYHIVSIPRRCIVFFHYSVTPHYSELARARVKVRVRVRPSARARASKAQRYLAYKG